MWCVTWLWYYFMDRDAAWLHFVSELDSKMFLYVQINWPLSLFLNVVVFLHWYGSWLRVTLSSHLVIVLAFKIIAYCVGCSDLHSFLQNLYSHLVLLNVRWMLSILRMIKTSRTIRGVCTNWKSLRVNLAMTSQSSEQVLSHLTSNRRLIRWLFVFFIKFYF